jgi:hypothetical protein
MKPIKPIPEWRKAWTFASMWVATAAGIFGALPPEGQAAVLEFMRVPPERVPLVLAVAFMVARVLKRGGE